MEEARSRAVVGHPTHDAARGAAARDLAVAGLAHEEQVLRVEDLPEEGAGGSLPWHLATPAGLVPCRR